MSNMFVHSILLDHLSLQNSGNVQCIVIEMKMKVILYRMSNRINDI